MKKSNFPIYTRLTTTLLILTILATGTLFAQERESQVTSSVKQKSGKKALTLSLVGTIVPLSILLSGIERSTALGLTLLGGSIVGPSLGYFYGGLNGRGIRGIGVRSLCFLTFVGGAAVAMTTDDPGAGAWILSIGGMGVGIIGIIGYFVSTIRDIASVHSAVQKRNEELRTIAFSISPHNYSSKENMRYWCPDPILISTILLHGK